MDEHHYSVGEEIAHTLTHGVGLLLSVGGLVGLVAMAWLRGDAWHVVGCTIFGVTLANAIHEVSTG